MSIDHGAVAGIGITLTDDMKETLINGESRFSDEEWEDDFEWCLEEMGLDCRQSGCFLSGANIETHIFVEGDTLADINKNAPGFIEKLVKFGLNVRMEDLVLIEKAWVG